MYLRSLRKHVAQCQQLSREIRDRQAEQRARGVEEQPAAPEPPAPDPPADPDPVPPANGQARKFSSRRSDDWVPATVHAAYKKRFPLRQMTLTDLPAPQSPQDEPCKCPFCSESFSTPAKCGHHSRACPSMPYPEWLRRVRVCQLDFVQSEFKCCHCQTGFATPKAAGRHSVACGKRRVSAGLSLNSREFSSAMPAIAELRAKAQELQSQGVGGTHSQQSKRPALQRAVPDSNDPTFIKLLRFSLYQANALDHVQADGGCLCCQF